MVTSALFKKSLSQGSVWTRLGEMPPEEDPAIGGEAVVVTELEIRQQD
jgi:hypothetical protein